MKITAVATHPVSIPLAEASWTAHEASDRSSAILVEVRTDAGLTGVGQIHAGPMSEVCKWVDRLTPLVLGTDPCALVATWEKLFELTCPRPGAMPARPAPSHRCRAALALT